MKEKNKPIAFAEFVALMMLLSSLAALSIDIVLPALPSIGKDLDVVEPSDSQLIVILLFLGMGLGQLFYGPLSDSIGRKPALSIGVGIFVLGCLLSVTATGFHWMLIGRFLQGLGLGAPRVVSIALIRDRYEGHDMSKVISIIMTIFVLVPMIAPALGALILLLFDWRMIFIFMSVVGLGALCWFGFRQSETLPKSCRRAFSLRPIARAMGEVLSNPVTLGYIFASGFISGAFLSYLSSVPQLFQQTYALGDLFPLIFSFLALAFGGASYVNIRLVEHMGLRVISRFGLWALSSVSIVFGGVTFFLGYPPFWMILSYLAIALFFIGILLGNINTLAMEPLRHIAGVGAAVIGFLSTLISVTVGLVIGQISGDSPLPLVVGFACCGLAALISISLAEIKRFRTVIE